MENIREDYNYIRLRPPMLHRELYTSYPKYNFYFVSNITIIIGRNYIYHIMKWIVNLVFTYVDLFVFVNKNHRVI